MRIITTKKELFKRAHLLARVTVKEVGDYMVAFKLGLEKAWKLMKEAAKPASERNVSLSHRGIVRQTAKAILVRCELESHYERSIISNIWFPKSRVEVTESRVILPAWLHSAKSRELSESGTWFAY